MRQCYEPESSVSILFSQLLNIKPRNARDLDSRIVTTKNQLAIAVANEGIIKTPAALIEKISLTKYISILTPNVKVLTKAKAPSTLNNLVEIAIEEQKATTIDEKSNIKNKISKQTTFKPTTFKLQQPFHSNSKSYERISEKIITYSYCKRTKHDHNKCYKRFRDKEQIRTLKEIESSDTGISNSDGKDESSNHNNLNSDD